MRLFHAWSETCDVRALMRFVSFAFSFASLFVASVASAAEITPPAPVAASEDVAAGGAPADGARRVVAVEITPLGLFVGHYGGALEIVPAPHHGLVLSAYYARVESGDRQFLQPDPNNPIAIPTNRYTGVGGEIGYRYYFGRLGPHGLYVGPSFLVGSYTADIAGVTAARSSVGYHDIGGALDLGYQALFGPVVVGIGAGVQYVHVDTSLPWSNDLYTEVSTRSAVRPRASFTLGVAF
jgi:hypothetical protein